MFQSEALATPQVWACAHLLQIRLGHGNAQEKGLGRVLLSSPAGTAGLLAVGAAIVMVGCGPTVKQLRIPEKKGGAQRKHMFAAQMIVMERAPPRRFENLG